MALQSVESDGQVLCRSFVGESIWALLDTDKEEFKRRVREYFALALPNHEVVKVRPSERVIFLRRRNG